MTYEAFFPFFQATAGAALVGLLFVAVSIRPEQVISRNAHPLAQASVTSTFTALVNGFFISCGALIPGNNMGFITAVFGVFGLLNGLSTGGELVRHVRSERTRPGDRWLVLLRGLFLVVATLVIYGFEVLYAWQVLRQPADRSPIYAISSLILTIYGLGLVRAWELLGARRSGLLAFLSPLRDLGEPVTPPALPSPPPASSAS